MAKRKILFINEPEPNKRGQYTFLDGNSSNSYTDSDGLPINADKFANKDLYSSVEQDFFNQQVIDHSLVYPGKSFVKIDKLIVNNAGTSNRLTGTRFTCWMFDSQAYNGNPMTDSWFNFWKNLKNNLEGYNGFSQFFDWAPGKAGKRWGPGTLLEDTIIIDDLNIHSQEGEAPYDVASVPHFNRGNDGFDPSRAFETANDGYEYTPEMTDIPFKPDVGQKIYIAVRMRGHDRRGGWLLSWTDRRKSRIQIFEIDADELFHAGMGKETTFTFGYSDSRRIEGGKAGVHAVFKNASTPCFRCDELQITFNTNLTADNEHVNNISEQLNEITGSVQSPSRLSMSDFDMTFLNQNPRKSIFNLNYLNGVYGVYNSEAELLKVKSNFEPIAEVSIGSSDDSDLQAYHIDDTLRQICSAPTQVNLSFSIGKYNSHIDGQSFEIFNGGPTPDYNYSSLLGYKFYVVDWNDTDNKFKTPEEFMLDRPSNFFDLIEKRENNLYNFSEAESSLTHNYQTPGIKTIKAVLFSYTKNTPNMNTSLNQALRWKFITIRFFLDIPINKYPDFTELGGAEYTTIPWQETSPIIGGIDENSQYKNSVRDTLSGGKIGDTDIIDETFLIDAQENDELGSSIKKFDLEQVRYFENGYYDMNTLLNIPTESDGYYTAPYDDYEYWDCDDWDTERNYCFSNETSVGQIFIGDNSDADLVSDCVFEFNCGNLTKKSIDDTSGLSNKGILIGDYRVKKRNKGQRMRRDSYIKTPKKAGKTRGAL